MHVFFSLVYWKYSLAFGADSLMYYNDTYGYVSRPVVSGTAFIVRLVQASRAIFGGSYLEYFILFQTMGLAGIIIVWRVVSEIVSDLEGQVPPWSLAFLFLPGLHFWTCAVGKDPPLFFGVSLALWAMIRVERRFVMLALALVVMYPIRPHIAGITAVACLLTVILDSRVRLIGKVILGALAAAATVVIVANVQNVFGLAALTPETLGDFIASRQEYGMRSEQGAVLAGLPFPAKVASLLFRPFFFDADGAFGLIVSLENLIILAVFVIIIWNIPTLVRLAASVTYMRFCLIFSSALILLLSAVTYNVGLGLRQKFMVMPAILVIFITIVVYRRTLRTANSVAATVYRSGEAARP